MDDRIKVHVCKYPDRANLVLLFKDPLSGKHVTRSAKTTNERKALKAAGEWEDALRNGRYVAPSRVTWADFREKYESEVLGELSQSTRHKAGYVLDVVQRVLNPQRVRDITAERLSYLQGELRKGQKLKGRERRPCSPSTVDGYMRTLRAALAYAVDWGYMAPMPKARRKKKRSTATKAKGRPLVAEEFDRLLAATPKVVGETKAEPWRHFLRGLWLSGLRLGEALRLYWNRDDCPDGECLEVNLEGRRPLLVIPESIDKSKRDRVLPITPDFAAFLAETPPEARTGPVFNPEPTRHHDSTRWRQQRVSNTVGAIGAKAGVVVNDKGKCASAHDLRRSFARRWSAKVMPQILMQLMRHADISTTLAYYATRDAEAVADILWGDSVNNLVNTPEKQRSDAREQVAVTSDSE